MLDSSVAVTYVRALCLIYVMLAAKPGSLLDSVSTLSSSDFLPSTEGEVLQDLLLG